MEHNLLSDYNDWDALSDRWSVVIFRHELCDVVRSPPSPLPSNSFHVDDNKNGINKFSDCLAPLSLSLPLFLAAVSLSLSLSVGGPTHTLAHSHIIIEIRGVYTYNACLRVCPPFNSLYRSGRFPMQDLWSIWRFGGVSGLMVTPQIAEYIQPIERQLGRYYV